MASGGIKQLAGRYNRDAKVLRCLLRNHRVPHNSRWSNTLLVGAHPLPAWGPSAPLVLEILAPDSRVIYYVEVMVWEGDGEAGVHEAVGGVERQLVQCEQRREAEAGHQRGQETRGPGWVKLEPEEAAAEVQLGKIQAEQEWKEGEETAGDE